ncbi:hypothetical protein M0R45_025090 [Rubus argutus]|uniref:Zinc finger PHD-type domain-containing protein n=1 Tax=Rubus argutus TaxID=59490 RepID=A0AAW1WX81_RUBAR
MLTHDIHVFESQWGLLPSRGAVLVWKTAVPKGVCPRAENEVDSDLKMELSSTERESDKHFLSGKSLKPGEESRAYNVCSASVSSCMQIKRVPSLVATKTDEFTDEVSKGKAVRSINDADLSSPLMSNACISINCTSGETNNPLTGDLIHDSLSGNKKMEDTSNASPSSEAFETLAKVNTASVVKSVGLNDRDPAFVGKCCDEMEYDEKCDGGSDTVEDEVNVCDICGDTGRELLLATCSRCSDGAEHIYCMRVKMDKLPGSEWLCEECMCKEESEKQDRRALDLKNRSRMNLKCARIEIKRNRDGSTPSITGKGSTGNIEAKSITKKRDLEMSVKSPRVSSPCRETVLHRDSSSKELSKKKIKATNDVISGDRSSESSLENAYLPVSSDKSKKLQSQTHMRKGTLLKSKSFHITHSKVKCKLSDEYGLQKNTVISNNAIGNNKKINTARTMGKSLSFDNARSNRPYGSDTKVKMPYHFKDLKKPAVAIEENSTQVKCTANLINPSVNSPMNTSSVLVPESDRKIVPSGQTSLLHFGSRGHDLENGHLKTNLSEATNKLAHEVSACLKEEQHKVVDDAKQHVDYSTKAAVAIGENNSKVTLHSEGKSYVRYSPNIFPLVFAVPQLDYIWKGGFEIWENGKLLVSRLSTWPTQFLENHATEDNIALYFFAENLESYGRNYKTLLECMVRDDLALRAKCDKVELLIFSSNLLPENSQSWNGMLFSVGCF